MAYKFNPFTGNFDQVKGGSGTIISLADYYTDLASSGTGATDVGSFTVPANTLANNGDKIWFSFSGNSTTSPNSGSVSVTFGGNVVHTSSTSIGTPANWTRQGFIIRVNSTTIRGSTIQGPSNTEYAGYDFTTGIIFKITLQAATSGIVTIKLGSVYYQAAA